MYTLQKCTESVGDAADMAALFSGRVVELLRQDRSTVPASVALAGKSYVLLFFSAEWCPPCHAFTPRLKAFYEAHQKHHNFEVVFVSRDNSTEEMQTYFAEAHGDWLALSFRDAQTIGAAWAQEWGLYGIPAVVVMDNTVPNAVAVVTSYGRDMVLHDPAALQFPWANADAIIIAARRAFMWKAAAVVVGAILMLCLLVW